MHSVFWHGCPLRKWMQYLVVPCLARNRCPCQTEPSTASMAAFADFSFPKVMYTPILSLGRLGTCPSLLLITIFWISPNCPKYCWDCNNESVTCPVNPLTYTKFFCNTLTFCSFILSGCTFGFFGNGSILYLFASYALLQFGHLPSSFNIWFQQNWQIGKLQSQGINNSVNYSKQSKQHWSSFSIWSKEFAILIFRHFFEWYDAFCQWCFYFDVEISTNIVVLIVYSRSHVLAWNIEICGVSKLFFQFTRPKFISTSCCELKRATTQSAI